MNVQDELKMVFKHFSFGTILNLVASERDMVAIKEGLKMPKGSESIMTVCLISNHEVNKISREDLAESLRSTYMALSVGEDK